MRANGNTKSLRNVPFRARLNSATSCGTIAGSGQAAARLRNIFQISGTPSLRTAEARSRAWLPCSRSRSPHQRNHPERSREIVAGAGRKE